MNVYIYKADIYCEGCGERIRDGLTVDGKAPTDLDDESGYDSDSFPKGPYADGGGESDSPQHCAQCGLFLENPLTSDGDEYLTELLTGEWDGRGGGDAEQAHASHAEWIAFYERDPEAPAFDKWGYFHGDLSDECIDDCSRPGQPADEAVEHWRKHLNFQVPRERAIDYLSEYGAWEEDEMREWDDDRLARVVLWIACGNVRDARHEDEKYPDPNVTDLFEWPGLIH